MNSRTATRSTAGFDRLRPRGPEVPRTASRQVAVVGRDVDGKRVLYSGAFDESVGPGMVVECSRCGSTSALSVRQAVGVLTPSLHLPLIRRGHPSLVRCPACRRPSWVRFRLTTRWRGGS